MAKIYPTCTGKTDAHDPLAKAKADCVTRLPTLADLPDPIPEDQNPNALFKGGYLRKGGGMILISTSGSGKSVMTIQESLCWSVGKPAFGMHPVRPLKIAIIQAEDDAEEMAYFRNQVSRGLVEAGVLDSLEAKTAIASILLPDFTGKVGDDFISEFKNLLLGHPDLDLVILNPLQSYFGGDLSKNSELSHFLRTGMDSVIKPDRVGLQIIHHTNKPPNAKERSDWGTDGFAAYVGAGGAELVNWARAVTALMPTIYPGLYTLVAGKRGKRLGWLDADGSSTTKRYIAHSEGVICWKDVNAKDAGVEDKGGPDMEEQAGKDAKVLAELARKRAYKLGDLREKAREKFKRNRGDRAFANLIAHLKDHLLTETEATFKGSSFIGTAADSEAAARKWDETKGKEY